MSARSPKSSIGASREDDTLLDRLVTAHAILCREQVLDAFGHISVRDPGNPGLFWLSAALPPSRVRRNDFIAFGLDGEPRDKTEAPLFAERFIHAEIYRARRDAGSICHHHALSILPFCVGSAKLAAVSQTGAFLGAELPLWDSADEFGDTRLLVDTPEQARSLARSLAGGAMVLMRGHGATVVGHGIEDLIFKAVYGCRDAEILRAAAALGPVRTLSAGECALAGSPSKMAVERGWSHWTAQLSDAHGSYGKDA